MYLHVDRKIWIIIPVFNRREPIQTLLKCLKEQTYQNYQVIAVDHGITPVFDEHDLSITSHHNFVVINEHDKNRHLTRIRDIPTSFHWSGAINLGIKYIKEYNLATQQDFIMFNNDDTTIRHDYLYEMVKVATGRERVVIGSVCVDIDNNKILYANLPLDRLRAKFCYPYYGKFVKDITTDLLYSDALKGRNAMFPANIFDEIGMPQEVKLPQNRSDHEISYRARKYGYQILVTTKAVIYTRLDTQVNIEKGNILRSIKDVLFGKKSHSNILELFSFSYLCFSPLYGTYFYLVNLLRTVAYVLLKPVKLIMK